MTEKKIKHSKKSLDLFFRGLFAGIFAGVVGNMFVGALYWNIHTQGLNHLWTQITIIAFIGFVFGVGVMVYNWKKAVE